MHAFVNFAPILPLQSHSQFTPSTNSKYTSTRCTRTRVCKRTAPRAAWADERLKPMPSIIAPTETTDWATFPGVKLEAPLALDIDDLLALVKAETPDEWPTEIVLTLLGWRRTADLDGSGWDNTLTRPAWLDSYPDDPPNFIGDRNDYSRELDLPVKTATQRLARSIYPEHKNAFRETFKPAGFPGWKPKDLNPNLTRRAVCANYILFWYRVHWPQWRWVNDQV